MKTTELEERTAKLNLDEIEQEVTECDRQAYFQIVSTSLTPEQEARILEPGQVFPKQDSVLAVHWHPEFVPMDLIQKRINTLFPNRREELIIPTQHNVLMTFGNYSGVEIDCYSASFNRKVQLLVHFAESKLEQADVLKAMLLHTFKYRSSQLFEFIDSILNPKFRSRVEQAAAKVGATDELIRFVQIHVKKIRTLIDQHDADTPPDMLKNKLIRNYFNTLRGQYPDSLIDRAQVFLRAIKKRVKVDFKLSYFYHTEEVIEEVRSLGGGILVPHPEQFWPILLADYDVDGIEVWNPQSQEYTAFLINVVGQQNKTRRRGRRPLLVFMGDDTHFGEKVLEPEHQDVEKANREIGVQPAWDDLAICKSMIIANVDRQSQIREYRSRLDS
ncbi:MAG: hypothetical protein MI923_12165 [Phycisphaerales bacterium]|nr:hypothetical protein [Phycisphaerales bacterium]